MSMRMPLAAPPVLVTVVVIVVLAPAPTGFGDAVAPPTVKAGGPEAPLVNVAVTVVVAAAVTAQAPVPLPPPPVQPAKVEPPAGVVVSVTTVPAGYVWEQSVPQSMPGGALVTVPAPVPARTTLSVGEPATGVVRRSTISPFPVA